MVKHPGNPVTSTFPKVGERRWASGEFEVEVVEFAYLATTTGRPCADPSCAS